MADALRVYFHFRSPYSRLGLHKIARMGADDRTDLTLIPFTGPAGGASFLNPTDSAPKIGYLMEDAPRMTALMDLPMAMPNPLDPDFAPSLTAFYAARRAGKALPFAIAVSDARWGDGKNIADPAVIAECAAKAGLGEHGDLAADAKRDVVEDRRLHDQDGAFGVPFAALEREGKRERFWGQDRFDLLAARLSAD